MNKHQTILATKPLTERKKELLEYIRKHPGQTAEELAENFSNSDEAYSETMHAIYGMFFDMYIEIDAYGQLYAREIVKE